MSRKLAGLQSYQISLTLENSGQTFSITQWYQQPNLVRTDVIQSEQPIYRFIYSGQQLQVWHLSSGQKQELAINDGNELFVSPLLLGFCQEAAQGKWQHDAATGLYHSSFLWSGVEGTDRQGEIWVNGKTLLPTEIHLSMAADNVVKIQVQSAVLNPPLDMTLFSSR